MKKTCSKFLSWFSTPPPRKSGFTLIELLVTVSIMGIIFGLTIIAYQRYNRSQIFQQAVEEFETNLRFAQGKASAGEKPGQSTDWCSDENESLGGYQVIVDSSNTYKIRAVCSGFSDPSEEYKDVKTDIALPAKISFDGGVGKSVMFNVLGFGVETEETFAFIGYDGIYTDSLTVTISGEIK